MTAGEVAGLPAITLRAAPVQRTGNDRRVVFVP
jgi:hypothetical protein